MIRNTVSDIPGKAFPGNSCGINMLNIVPGYSRKNVPGNFAMFPKKVPFPGTFRERPGTRERFYNILKLKEKFAPPTTGRYI